MALPMSSRGRHRRPSKTAPVVAAGGMTVALVGADAALLSGAASAQATDDQLRRLRQCESGGNYSINTGNGYYGAYQFALGTWRGLGYSGYPHQASPGTQDQAARDLQERSGWGQWPACARKMGLYGESGERASRSSTRSSSSAATTQRAPKVRVVVAPTAPPPFTQHLHAGMVKQVREDVRQWQQRMKDRGWQITVDGRFGAQSAAIATKFAQEKKLTRTKPGIVNGHVWTAAWRMPVA